MDKVVDFINVNRDRYVDELKKYLASPSISALPEHKGDVRKCAEWTADEMRRIGLQSVRLERHPATPSSTENGWARPALPPPLLRPLRCAGDPVNL